MRKVIASIYLSLDGVMENPAWTMPYWNDEAAAFAEKQFYACDTLLLGRITYQAFAAAWPSMTHEGDFAVRMNAMPKFVATTTLEEAEWNATLLKGDVVAEVAKLKQQPGQDLLIYGSADLVETLRPHNLIDEYRLWIYPVVVGSGKRLFQDGSVGSALRLIDTVTTSTGISILTYVPVAGDQARAPGVAES